MVGSRKTNGVGVQVEDTQICVVMVGLPARGKSLISQKGSGASEDPASESTDWLIGAATRYLKWLSIKAKVFNVGSYRRTATAHPTADFFDTKNPEGERLRRAAAEAAVTDMLKWFEEEKGTIAILDATNSTKERRRWIHERCTAQDIEILFVESKCDDEDLIMSNILEVKTTSPDYIGQDPEQAAQDFRNRIRNYEKVYQTIGEEESDMTYIKIMNVGKQVIINKIQDYLQSRVVYFLMNLHIKPRSIWISRVSLSAPFWRVLAKYHVSTVNPSTILMAKLVGTQIYQIAVSFTLRNFRSWFDSLLV
jgi:6-phosphofructo-2-kinase / fructose-2,6-biphosphatase 2